MPEVKGETRRVAAALIAGDGVTPEQWGRCLSSLVPHVDGIFIAYNGKKILDDETFTEEIGAEEIDLPIYVQHFEWEDNFAKARQQSFNMVLENDEQYDWIVWVDTDDTLESDGSTLNGLIDSLDTSTQGVFLRYDYAVDEETGTVAVEQWRERLFRTDGNWLWKYPIHEVCHGSPGTQYSRKPQFWVRHWRKPGENDEITRIRNRRIIGKAMEREPHEPRHTFYMAGEMLAEAAAVNEIDKAQAKPLLELTIELYSQFLKMAPWADDTYIANHRMAECYRMLGNYNKAVDTDLQGIKIMPSWPDSYLGIAQSYMAVKEWDKVRDWARMCLFASTKPETTQVIEPMNINYIPHLLAGVAFEELGDLDEALSHYETAAESFCPSDLAEKIERLVEQGVTETHSGAGGPSEQRRSLRGSRPERSIAFCTRPLFEPWHPELEKKGGAGGAETCIMRLAPLFAREGWRVAVFGTPGEHKGVDADGVEWWDAAEFDTQEPFSVVVASRCPEIFDSNIAGKLKFNWLHDVNLGEDGFSSEWGDRWSKADRAVCLTDWHRNHTARLYGVDPNTIEVIGNGVDLSRFDIQDESVRDPNRFVYASSPDRGLDTLLTVWGDIRERIPEAQLHVFYGWDAIDKIIAAQPDGHPQKDFLTGFKAGIEQLIKLQGGEEGGIHWHGRVPQQRLADEYRRSNLWLYPTAFLETFCITAVETQAAGMIPCSTAVGALPETVAVQQQLLKGHPANFDYQNRFVDLVEKTYHRDEASKQDWRGQGRGHSTKFGWDGAYAKWKAMIEHGLA